MSAFIKGLFACSVGPLKLSLRISSIGYLLLSWRSITGPNFKPGGLTSPEISRGGICPPPLSLPLKSQRSPYEGLSKNRELFRQAISFPHPWGQIIPLWRWKLPLPKEKQNLIDQYWLISTESDQYIDWYRPKIFRPKFWTPDASRSGS